MFQSPTSPHPDHQRAISPNIIPSHTGHGYPELTPGDSASVTHGDERSTVSSHTHGTFSFKFNYGGKTHRFRSEYSSYAALRETVRQKIMTEHLSLSQSYVNVPSEAEEDDSWLTIAYLDDEDDQVLMASDADVEDAVNLARKLGQDRVRLFVQDALLLKQQEEQAAAEAAAAASAAAAAAAAAAEEAATASSSTALDVPPGQPTISVVDSDRPKSRALTDADEASADEAESDDASYTPKRRHRGKRDVAAEYNLPIPQEMLLPAAITFLGVVILGVFTVTKLTSSDRRY